MEFHRHLPLLSFFLSFMFPCFPFLSLLGVSILCFLCFQDGAATPGTAIIIIVHLLGIIVAVVVLVPFSFFLSLVMKVGEEGAGEGDSLGCWDTLEALADQRVGREASREGGREEEEEEEEEEEC